MAAWHGPIFDPWAVEDSDESVESLQAVEGSGVEPALESVVQESDSESSFESAAESGDSRVEAVDRLRAVATSCFHAVSQRLRMAGHETALEDRLDEPSRLLRFEVSPRGGPLGRAPPGSAMLEIGLGPGSGDVVTAWYWLDRTSEAPERTTSVALDGLGAAWVEHVILDFVGKALARG